MKPGSLSHALGSAMGARIGVAVLNYGLFWSLSHRLGTTLLGGFSLLMNIYFMSALLPLLGLSAPLTRRAATERDTVATEMSNAFLFAAPIAVLLMLAIGVVGHLAYEPELRLPFWMVGLAILPTTSTLIHESTLMGLERVADIARMQFVEALLRTGFTVLVVRLGYGLDGVFEVFVALRFLIAFAYRFHPMLPRFQWQLVSRAIWSRNWHEAPIYLGIGLLAVVVGRIDMVVLSRVSGLHAVGIYAAASRLYDASLMLPNIAAMSVMPTLARLFASDRGYFRSVLVLALRLSLGVGLVIAFVVAAFAQPLIHLLYRPEVAAAAPVLRWLIFGAVLMTLDQIVSSTMMAAHAQKNDLRALAVGLTTLAIGLAALTPGLGATGAAMAVTLAIGCRIVYRLRWIVKLLAIEHLARDLSRVLVSGGVGIVVLVIVLQFDTLPMNAVLACIASVASYLAMLLATGALELATLAAARTRAAALFGR